MISNISRLKDHLEKLHGFVIIAEMGSLARASKVMNTSQAALSHSLKILESALELRLFDRNSRGVTLTSSGKILYDSARSFLQSVENIEEQLKSISKMPLEKIRIGTHEGISLHLFPDFLPVYLKSNPALRLSIAMARVNELLEGLRESKYDVIISVEPKNAHEFKLVPLFETELVFVCSTEKFDTPPLSCLNGTTITLKEANSLPIFTDLDAHKEQFVTIKAMLNNIGIYGVNPIDISSYALAIKMVTKGLGLALLPLNCVSHLIQKGALKTVQIEGIAKEQLKLNYFLTRLSSAGDNVALNNLTLELIKYFSP